MQIGMRERDSIYPRSLRTCRAAYLVERVAVKRVASEPAHDVAENKSKRAGLAALSGAVVRRLTFGKNAYREEAQAPTFR